MIVSIEEMNVCFFFYTSLQLLAEILSHLSRNLVHNISNKNIVMLIRFKNIIADFLSSKNHESFAGEILSFRIGLKKDDIVLSVFSFSFFSFHLSKRILIMLLSSIGKILLRRSSTKSIEFLFFFFFPRSEIRKSTTIIKWTILFVRTYVRSFVGYNRRSHKIVGR